jgi:hypothetical protein
MAVSVSETERKQDVVHGKLIALEGNTDFLATQLRLLPPSEKFLIVPSSMSQNFSDDDDFSPRSFVRAVHLAFEERIERARAFLTDGTNTHPRLVFMNGGSVSARSMCISRICQHTNGDVRAAEIVFNDLVKAGVAGLMKDTDGSEGVSEGDTAGGPERIPGRDADVQAKMGAIECEEEQVVESPHSKFMKAPDFLKRETGSLQSDVQKEPTYSSTKAMGASQSAEDVPAHRQGIFTTEHGDEIVRTVLTIPSRPTTFMDQKRGTFGSQYDNTDYDQYADIASPGDGSLMSGGPPTPGVVFGEACLVDMASASPTKPRRAASFDRFYPSNSRFLGPPSSPRPLKHTKSAYHLRTRPSTSEGKLHTSRDGFPKLPRTMFVKASETTIRRSPTSAGSSNSSTTSLQVPGPRTFVDRGTDSKEALELECFMPIFPVVEDFILQLEHGKTDAISERVRKSVIRTSKEGTYPGIPPSMPSSTISDSYDSPTSPLSASSLRHRDILRQPSKLTVKSDNTGQEEYDPYADYSPHIKRRWPEDRQPRFDGSATTVAPPTPTLTPPPIHGNAEKFLDFTPINVGNAINAQNSLRQLLSMHFPAGEYSQHYYPVAPEAERLWKPVFRNDESSSIGNEGRTVDQILALGCEEGVKQHFFLQISGQVSRLGTKKDGMTVSECFPPLSKWALERPKTCPLTQLSFLLGNI